MDVIDRKFCEMLLLYKIVHEQSWEDIVSKTLNIKLHEIQVKMNQIKKSVKDSKDDMTKERDR